jgi:uncharacterized protein (DUF433 family)
MIDWREYIESNPNKLFGKPVIKNTRIPVDLLLEKLAKEETIEELLEAYPRINQKAIFAVFAYAAAFIRNENTY